MQRKDKDEQIPIVSLGCFNKIYKGKARLTTSNLNNKDIETKRLTSSKIITRGHKLPSSKTSYIEENTKASEVNAQFNTGFVLKGLGALQKCLAHGYFSLKRP